MRQFVGRTRRFFGMRQYLSSVVVESCAAETKIASEAKGTGIRSSYGLISRNRRAGHSIRKRKRFMSENHKTPSLYLKPLQLRAEIDRCLGCKAQPCMTACPVNCNPYEFISFAKNGDWSRAVTAITRNNPLGQTCGLICPDKFCMRACTRNAIDFPINIPKVQATILQKYHEHAEPHPVAQGRDRRVAVVGAGPAGIAAAARLARAGISVVIFEALDKIGGALNMIPRERLPHDVIVRDWNFIQHNGNIELRLNAPVDDLAQLCKAYYGVIVATGEPHCMALGIEGEEHSVSYMDYLHAPEKYPASGSVAVIGGGNVAADCAMTAARNGAASVEMFVRRRVCDMRISKSEYFELLSMGISPNGMMSPEKIESHGDLKTLYVHKNVYRDGKWMPLPHSTLALPYFSLVIRAIGSRADAKLDPLPENLVYAGDCKTGGSTIVEAIASGRAASLKFIE